MMLLGEHMQLRGPLLTHVLAHVDWPPPHCDGQQDPRDPLTHHAGRTARVEVGASIEDRNSAKACRASIAPCGVSR